MKFVRSAASGVVLASLVNSAAYHVSNTYENVSARVGGTRGKTLVC